MISMLKVLWCSNIAKYLALILFFILVGYFVQQYMPIPNLITTVDPIYWSVIAMYSLISGCILLAAYGVASHIILGLYDGFKKPTRSLDIN